MYQTNSYLHCFSFRSLARLVPNCFDLVVALKFPHRTPATLEEVYSACRARGRNQRLPGMNLPASHFLASFFLYKKAPFVAIRLLTVRTRECRKDAPDANPRGIPKAPFVDKVEDYVSSREEVETTLRSFQEMISYVQFEPEDLAYYTLWQDYEMERVVLGLEY